MWRWTLGGVALLAVLFVSVPSRAAEFYVDPAGGNMQNDGSAAHPWSTLQAVIEGGLVETQNWDSLPHGHGSVLVAKNPGAPVKAGDTIWLLLLAAWRRNGHRLTRRGKR